MQDMVAFVADPVHDSIKEHLTNIALLREGRLKIVVCYNLLLLCHGQQGLQHAGWGSVRLVLEHVLAVRAAAGLPRPRLQPSASSAVAGGVEAVVAGGGGEAARGDVVAG